MEYIFQMSNREVKNVKYIIATRPYGLIASFVPFTIGSLVAMRSGTFSFFLFIVALLALLFIHAASNTANDYFDFKNGVDRPGTLGSTGSGLLINGKITMREEKIVMVTCFVIGAALGVWIVALTGFTLLWFGLAGILGGYFYTANPVSLKYRGFGLPLVFVLYGPLTVLGAQYVQMKTFTYAGAVASIPVGIATVMFLLANEVRDTGNDRSIGLKSFPIIFGDMAGAWLYLVLFVAQYLFIFYMIAKGMLSLWGLLSLAPVYAYARVTADLFGKARGTLRDKDIAVVDMKSAFSELFLGIGMMVGMVI